MSTIRTRGRYFFEVCEFKKITGNPQYTIHRLIESKKIFAIKIGKNWRVFLDTELEKGNIDMTFFDIPDILNKQKISDILFLSEHCVQKYVLKGYKAFTKEKFLRFIYENSNLFLYQNDKPKEMDFLKRMTSPQIVSPLVTMVPQFVPEIIKDVITEEKNHHNICFH